MSGDWRAALAAGARGDLRVRADRRPPRPATPPRGARRPRRPIAPGATRSVLLLTAEGATPPPAAAGVRPARAGHRPRRGAAGGDRRRGAGGRRLAGRARGHDGRPARAGADRVHRLRACGRPAGGARRGSARSPSRSPAAPRSPPASTAPELRACPTHTEYAYSVAMSIRHGLLALLERGPMYGYQLRSAFEESTGSTWPLNIGQVYTTLSRLERDGLVRPLPENDGGQRPYEITERGARRSRCGSPPRSAAPTGPATSSRSSWPSR